MPEKIIVFTDGACSGNPGPGGWGTIICFDKTLIHELGGKKTLTTNNKMELLSVIEALNYLAKNNDEIAFYTDSTYVINGVTKWMWGWAKKNWINSENNPVSNRDLWEQLYSLVAKKKDKLTWNYVRGHTGVVGNERCDQIAVSFSRDEEVYLYKTEYENYPYKIFPLPANEALPEAKFGAKNKTTKEVSYYISVVGGVVTRHETWKDCEMAVKGRSGAKFKKVKDQAEQEQVLKGWGYGSKK